MKAFLLIHEFYDPAFLHEAIKTLLSLPKFGVPHSFIAFSLVFSSSNFASLLPLLTVTLSNIVESADDVTLELTQLFLDQLNPQKDFSDQSRELSRTVLTRLSHLFQYPIRIYFKSHIFEFAPLPVSPFLFDNVIPLTISLTASEIDSYTSAVRHAVAGSPATRGRDGRGFTPDAEAVSVLIELDASCSATLEGVYPDLTRIVCVCNPPPILFF